ncbi:hypothetical protein [Tabrizicola sp.]|mgnify:CR=1 FL=1|jgi:hypothetical protein|uniref:hypothetical protein n=1 Tax=Tabrizicola sp. TaxID=2005166 RepID=UPI0035AF7690
MSAPQTDPERQLKRHRVPIIGMALVVLFALGVIIYWLFEEVSQSDPPPPETPAGASAPAEEGTATPDPGTQP